MPKRERARGRLASTEGPREVIDVLSRREMALEISVRKMHISWEFNSEEFRGIPAVERGYNFSAIANRNRTRKI